ncbi:MAG TPA: APC family permease [Xanthomonadaceae bacterium]|nr:APC family permease [Xanthomonadaceae bacterium]
MAKIASEVGTSGIRVDAALVRGIGFWALAASVLNNTVGGGVFENPGSLAKDLGAVAPWVLLLGALVFIPIALCFSAAGSRIHTTGGAYSYVGAAFGPFSGYVVASLLWISNVAASGAIAASLSDQVAYFAPVVAHPLPRAAFIVGAYLVLCMINARGVRIGARAIMAMATIKLTPLILLVVVGLFYIHPANLHVSALPQLSVVAGSMGLVLFAYSGMETALLPSGEVRDPSSVVPRATLAAIILVVLVYVGLQVVAQGVLGSALAGAKSPLTDVAGLIAPAFRIVLLFAASVSLYGFMQNDIFGSSRLLYALARDGFLPSPLARITPTHRVPLLAVALYAIIATVLAIQGGFTALALFSGKAICPVYIGVCIAAWYLQRHDLHGEGKPFMLYGGPIIPLIGCISMGWILSTMERNEWLAMGGAMVVVIFVYGVVRWLRGSKALPDG